MIELGIKTDAVQYRYSYPWLFDLMAELGVKYVQLGSFFELYSLEDAYFYRLKEEAEQRGLCIKSVFTAHRELGGFFVDDPYLEKAARQSYEKLIHVAALLEADYCGSNPGAVYRDQIDTKTAGVARYLKHLKELSQYAYEKGLKALTVEPMSCQAEPPTTEEEIRHFMQEMQHYHAQSPDTVPTYLCGDISHGYINAQHEVVHSNLELFRYGIPYMAEFHFKNTDQHYLKTFGFSDEEQAEGIVNLTEIKAITDAGQWPVPEVVGYLEISGPKLGRDHTDRLLRPQLISSVNSIQQVFRAINGTSFGAQSVKASTA